MNCPAGFAVDQTIACPIEAKMKGFASIAVLPTSPGRILDHCTQRCFAFGLKRGFGLMKPQRAVRIFAQPQLGRCIAGPQQTSQPC